MSINSISTRFNCNIFALFFWWHSADRGRDGAGAEPQKPPSPQLTTRYFKQSELCLPGRGNVDPRGEMSPDPFFRGPLRHCSATQQLQRQEGHTQLSLPNSISQAPLIALMINCGHRVYLWSRRAPRASALTPNSTLTVTLLKGWSSCSFSLFWQSAKLADIITANTLPDKQCKWANGGSPIIKQR